jgi:hypothetical protein
MGCFVATHSSSHQDEAFADSFGLFAMIVMGTFVIAIVAAVAGLIALS